MGAILIGRWARELYGDAGGLLGICLWCCFPTVMAFAQVVTPDVPATVAGLAAAYGFWHYLRRPTGNRAILTGALLGLAESTKFTHLVLYPIWAVLWAAQRRARPATHLPVAQAAVIVIASLVAINASYGFRGTGRALRDFTFYSLTLSGADGPETGTAGNRFRGQLVGAVPVPLPEDYVQGIDLQRRDFEVGFPSYLCGVWQRHGWWYYYIYAAAIKLPLGTLALFLWGLGRLPLRHSGPASGEAFLALHGFAYFFFVSAQTGFSHHFRYVLPAFPFFIVLASGTATGIGARASQDSPRRGAIGVDHRHRNRHPSAFDVVFQRGRGRPRAWRRTPC